MKRQVLFLGGLGVCLLVAGWLWPGAWGTASGVVLALFLTLGLWGTFSLRSGVWCRARWRGEARAGLVALTYDDGPDPATTPALLDLLEEFHVQASFFCVGEKVLAHPEIMRRMRAAGHVVGNHSHRHSYWSNFYMTRRMTAEIEAAQAAIEEVLGFRPTYYRPPIGLANHVTGDVATAMNLTIVGWQVRGIDLPGSDPSRVARRVLKGLKEGGVILLHDGDRLPETVVEATRQIIEGLKARDLRPVTLDALFSEG